MRLHLYLFTLLNVLLFYSNGVNAQDNTAKTYYQPLQDVFQTELVYPQEKGEIQLTLNPEYGRTRDLNHISFPVLAEYGITDNWQLGFSWNSFQNNFGGNNMSVSGIGDIEFDTQYSFMNIGETNFHAALGFELEIPLSREERGIGEGRYEYMPYSLFAVDFPSLNNIQFFTQAGFSFSQNKTENDEEEGNELFLSGGLFVPVKKVIFDIELTSIINLWENGNENQLYLTPGIILNLPGAWETGLGTSIGLNKESDKYLVLAILTFEFNLMKEGD
ncbi:transporter [Maribellus maritimus]|uniref:transporter n=1 Tax=Maribellus maritimus TaxID=2870838 RepID=UPI001EEA6AF5|nr:transporter [Maribellus maritimus]MCG6190820.1 transporter [Maribellus maritimus]